MEGIAGTAKIDCSCFHVEENVLLTDVSQTFREQEIFLTGANGFLGKVIIGFLLGRYPDFRHLHVLVRPRGVTSALDRFRRDVLGSPALAAILKDLNPDLLASKISVIAGDIGEPDCGIHSQDLERLRGRVGLIINCAGLVEFFPPVDTAFQSNVDGVEHVVALSRQLGAKLLHVSTCFVCGEGDGLIEETEPILGFYPRRRGPPDRSFRHTDEIRYMRERVRQLAGASGARRTKQLNQRLTDLGRQRAAHWGWVNTYTYSKSLGEQIIASQDGLDWAVVRPAIVESAVEFPFPGWVEGGRTAAPLILMALSGLRHWTIRPDNPLEVVPVDFVAASILAVGALLLRGKAEKVYQLGTADVNPILLDPLVQLLHEASRNGVGKSARPAARLPSLPLGPRILTPAEVRQRRIRLQRRLARAQHFVTALRKLLHRAGLPGRRPLGSLAVSLRALGLQALIREQTLELYQPFTLDNRYIFESENIRAAYSLLSDKDRDLLPWFPERINWRDYWMNHQIAGVRKWVGREATKGWTFQA